MRRRARRVRTKTKSWFLKKKTRARATSNLFPPRTSSKADGAHVARTSTSRKRLRRPRTTRWTTTMTMRTLRLRTMTMRTTMTRCAINSTSCRYGLIFFFSFSRNRKHDYPGIGGGGEKRIMRGAGFNGREFYVVMSCLLFYVQLYRFIMTNYRVIVIPEGSIKLL